MGMFDLPSPVLSAVDSWLGGLLPPAWRLVAWAAIVAVIGLELYRLCSPQHRIAESRRAFEEARDRLAGFDGEFEEAWPFMRAMFAAALRRLAQAFPATVVAALPFVIAVVWLDNTYGAVFPPPGTPVAVTVAAPFEAAWTDDRNGGRPVVVVRSGGAPVAEVALAGPSTVVHKRQWWNRLLGNPAGYLADDLPFERLDIALPRLEVIGAGPGWLRGWEGVFLVASFVFAVAFKSFRRIA